MVGSLVPAKSALDVVTKLGVPEGTWLRYVDGSFDGSDVGFSDFSKLGYVDSAAVVGAAAKGARATGEVVTGAAESSEEGDPVIDAGIAGAVVTGPGRTRALDGSVDGSNDGVVEKSKLGLVDGSNVWGAGDTGEIVTRTPPVKGAKLGMPDGLVAIGEAVTGALVTDDMLGLADGLAVVGTGVIGAVVTGALVTGDILGLADGFAVVGAVVIGALVSGDILGLADGLIVVGA